MIFLEEIQAWVIKSETFFTQAFLEELGKHNGEDFHANDKMMGEAMLSAQGLILEALGPYFVKEGDVSFEIRYAIFEKTIKEGFQNGTLFSNAKRLNRPTEKQKAIVAQLKQEKEAELQKIEVKKSLGMGASVERAVRSQSIKHIYAQKIAQAGLCLDTNEFKKMVQEVITEALGRAMQYEKQLSSSLIGRNFLVVDDRHHKGEENGLVLMGGPSETPEPQESKARPLVRESVGHILNTPTFENECEKKPKEKEKISSTQKLPKPTKRF